MNFIFYLFLVNPLFIFIGNSFLVKLGPAKFFNKLSSIISFVILIVLSGKANINSSLEIINIGNGLSLEFSLSKNLIILLFLLNILWIAAIFYFDKLVLLDKSLNYSIFSLSLTFIICFLYFFILSRSIASLLFSYSFLVLGFCFLLEKFALNNFRNHELRRIILFAHFSEIILLFFAIILTFKWSGYFSLQGEGLVNDLSKTKTITLLILYFFANFLTVIFPFYLFYYKKINYNNFGLLYILYPLFTGAVKLFMLIKIITEIFSIGIFINLSEKILFIFQNIFVINFLISISLLLIERDFKKIFLHLFFSQFIFSILTILIFIQYEQGNFYNILYNFILTISLLFFSFCNVNLYLKKSESKIYLGLFNDMKFTISLMLFGFLNLVGIFPALGLFEKLSLLKIIFVNKLFLIGMIFFINFVVIILIMIKIFHEFFANNEKALSENEKNLAKKIDLSSSFILVQSSIFLIIICFKIYEYYQ